MALLLLSSIFYMSFIPAYIFVVIFIIVFDFYTAKYIERKAASKKILVTGIVINLLVLAFFKYFVFTVNNFNSLFSKFNLNFHIPAFDFLLPLGMSFYIFKSISYLVEVHRRTIPAEKNFNSFALYIMLYPELLAGPIDKPQNLIPQFNEKHDFNYENLTAGSRQIIWGLFLKTVIADRLAVLVDKVYSSPLEHTGLHLIIATVFFAIQIYTDFAGYSYIAIGCGRILGFRLMKNFDHPYFSESISEFWRRWHISLSVWLRDYLFLPLAYSFARKFQNLKSFKVRTDIASYCCGILITMLIAGLWHGAGWNFVFWGGLIGIYLMMSVLTSKFRKRLRRKYNLFNFSGFKIIRIIFIFSLMCFAWIFFRAADVNEAFYIISRLGDFSASSFNQASIGLNKLDFILSMSLILFLIIAEYLQYSRKIYRIYLPLPDYIKLLLFGLLIIIMLLLGNFSSNQFIYFQF
jgi:D-alanyl-lipoteichoic acid acyltransferase DltB (MBOAT superfamily)